MTDENLTEYYNGMVKILHANHFTLQSCKSIDFGLQVGLSRNGKSGFIRIYQRRDKTLSLDYSLIKDPALRESVWQVLEKTRPSAVPARKVPPTAAAGYDVGYPVIGTDESGKGDYFGPLVCAAVCVDANVADALRSAGVRDSKTCTDREIHSLAEKIRTLCAGKFEIIEIPPERYNTLHGQLTSEGKNLNTMLAWGHARAIEELLKHADCKVAIADQFADKRYILGKLQERGRMIQLIQMHKAEENIAVAAASILARARFIAKMADLSAKYGMTFPFGASAAVIRAGQEFVKKHGAANLPLVAKMHFRTTAEVMGKDR
jgi:ribonuclease HIII